MTHLTLGLWLSVALSAQVERTEPIRFDRLDNGLEIVAVEDATFPLVSVQLWFNAGLADGAVTSRVAHAVRMSAAGPALRELSAAGARIEAGVLPDACFLTITTTADALDVALDAARAFLATAAPRTTDPKAGPSVLAWRVETVGLQWYEAVSGSLRSGPSRDDRWRAAVLESAFRGHPYARMLKPSVVKAANVLPLALSAFLATWSVPGNARLVVVGNLPVADALLKAKERFRDVAWAEPPRRAVSELPEPKGTLVVVDALRAGVDLVWVTPRWGDFDNAVLDTLLEVLCNPVDGRLRDVLRRSGYSAPNWCRESWKHAGLTILSADRPRRAEATLEPLESLLVASLRDVARTGVSPIALNGARTAVIARLRARTSAFGEHAKRLALHEMVGRDLMLSTFELERYARVTVHDLQAAANDLAENIAVRVHRRSVPRKAPTNGAAMTRNNLREADSAGSGAASEGSVVNWNEPRSPTIETITVEAARIRVAKLASDWTSVAVVLPQFADRRAGAAPIGETDVTIAALRDVARYNGLVCALHSPTVLLVSGASAQLPELMEVATRLARHPDRAALVEWLGGAEETAAADGPAAGPVNGAAGVAMAVCGNVTPASVESACRQYCAEWLAAAPGESRRPGVRDTQLTTDRTTTTRPVSHHARDDGNGWVVVQVPQSLTPTQAWTIAYVLGLPDPAAIAASYDDVPRSTWHAAPLDDQRIRCRLVPGLVGEVRGTRRDDPDERIKRTVSALIAALDRLRDSTRGRDAFRGAWRAARRALRVRVDGPQVLAPLLLRWESPFADAADEQTRWQELSESLAGVELQVSGGPGPHKP